MTMRRKVLVEAGIAVALIGGAGAALKYAMGDIDLGRVLAAKPKEHVEQHLAELTTVWGASIDEQSVLPEHPRPQFEREAVQLLHGVWKCGFAEGADGLRADEPRADECALDILVPFSPESRLSGVESILQPEQTLLYRHEFACSDAIAACERAVLHFDAVDYRCAVWLNGTYLGEHVGGYTPFAFDVTGAIDSAGTNVLALAVLDPTEKGTQLRGKQRLSRGDMWYTGQSGIWQPVWLEGMPESHVASLGADSFNLEGDLRLKIDLVGSADLGVSVLDEGGSLVARQEVPSATGDVDLELHVEEPKPWSPEDPRLYTIEITFGSDLVKSYCAFRTVGVGRDEQGVTRFMLNGSPYFLKGVLDQGYWPESLMTAPSDEALAFDIRAMKDAGFNMLRKHIKLERARWYYHCDRLGMIVWQDMVSGGDVWNDWYMSYMPTLFQVSWDRYGDTTQAQQKNLLAADPAYREEWAATCREVVDLLKGEPCVGAWVLFNEGWGQFDSLAAVEEVRRLDETRPIDATSGWYDQHGGDFKSIHNYFRPQQVWPDSDWDRAYVVSEFGGLVCNVAGHSSLDTSYGYDVYEDVESWRSAASGLFARMEGLRGEGLSGYVWTQVSDIEEETNGILTYDRRVNKLEGVSV